MAWRRAPRQPPGWAAGPVVSSPALAELPFPAARGRGRGAEQRHPGALLRMGGTEGRRGCRDAALVSVGGGPGGV